MLEIAKRFNGPPSSGNGGYSCGVFASLLDGPAEVTLRAPPPLETPFTVERSADGARVLDGGTLVAEVRARAPGLDPPPPVSIEHARASERPVFPPEHPFPTCFVCGTQREPGDGLRIFAGPVAGRDDLLAATWLTPGGDATDDVVPAELVWASLDCPSGYAALLRRNEMMLLGRLTAELRAPVRAGEPHVVLAWPLDSDGRKLHAGSALFDAGGELKAIARATWIVLA